MPWFKSPRTAYLALITVMLPVGAGVMASAARPVARPQRIVSFNMCADQYLLALADPAQIAGLTRNATNRELSAAADKVGRIHILSSAAEEVMAINPDLVVGAPARRGLMMEALAGQNYRTVPLESAESYADIVAQIRTVAAAVGHVARGEALVARMDRALTALPKAGQGKVAAYYQRRGFLTGTGTLIDELMRRVGLVNLAGRLGKPVLSQMSLEELMVARPDYLIVESATDRVTDQGTEMLHHPLLRHIPRLRIPQAWTVCGGPAYVLAAESLVRQLRARR